MNTYSENNEIEQSQLKVSDKMPKSKEWLTKFELIVKIKYWKGGALISSNKYSETLKQIIFSVI